NILPYLNEIVITKISKIEKDSKKSPDFLSGDLCMKDSYGMGCVWNSENIVRKACFLNRLHYRNRMYPHAIRRLSGISPNAIT
ncbi:hypothetical protein, partial [Photorhabdus sp. RM105S]|uniref:hypothetical protein n=1 Tax=Photorhabdus sp. RM105S TaxID=3342823 RepID=UPI0036D9CD9B